MMTQIEQLVSKRKIIEDAKRTQTEAELIDSHDDMINAVKRAPATAMSGIVNYTKKKRKYLKEQAELNATTGAVQPDPIPAAGSIASYNKLITTHLNRHGIVATEKGTKFGAKTLNIP
jgi:hypothetical protein